MLTVMLQMKNTYSDENLAKKDECILCPMFYKKKI